MLTSYQNDIESFAIEPGESGDFEFSIDGELVYSKKQTGEYPEMQVIKQAVVSARETRATASAAG